MSPFLTAVWREREFVRLAGKWSVANEDHVITATAQQQPITLKQPQLSQISYHWELWVLDFGHILYISPGVSNLWAVAHLTGLDPFTTGPWK